MKIKDFSEVITLLNQNGVGIAKLYFRMNVGIPDFCLFLSGYKMEDSKARKIMVHFSDGNNYLGSIVIAQKNPLITLSCVDLQGEFEYDELRNFPESDYNFSLYIDPKYGISKEELIIDFTNISPASNLGTCTILSNIIHA